MANALEVGNATLFRYLDVDFGEIVAAYDEGPKKMPVGAQLTLEGDKLSGTVSGRNNSENKIEDATFKNGEVTFNVVRERDGQKRTTKYKGKLDGDTIKGKSESERDGQKNERDWEAKREKK